MRSKGSSSSISLAMDTPSLVIVGAPHFFSNTTLRPFGPSVTLTASARAFMPRSMPRRASSSKAMIFAMGVVPLSRVVALTGARDGRCPPRRSCHADAHTSPEEPRSISTLTSRVLIRFWHSPPESANADRAVSPRAEALFGGIGDELDLDLGRGRWDIERNVVDSQLLRDLGGRGLQ